MLKAKFLEEQSHFTIMTIRNFSFLKLSMDQSLILGIIALGAFLLGYFFAKIYFLNSIRRHRSQAIKQSQFVLRGHAHEKLAPFLSGFPYQARDMNFIGKGVDYIVFDGLSQGTIKEIILLEIKSGSSTQNRNERLIEQAIKQGKVRYEIFKK